MGTKLYVLIRADLSQAQQGIQAGHAVAEWMRLQRVQNYAILWKNEILVYLSVKDINCLAEWFAQIMEVDKKAFNNLAAFYEPDMDNQPTTIACYTDNKNLFSKLPLWNPIVP